MKAYLRILLNQAVMDFRRRYLGTVLGGAWAIISPLITIALIYFVLTFGLKSGAMGNISFVNWLVPGMLAWFFMSESIIIATTSIIESSYLVTKIIFPVRILPISKVISCLPVHIGLMFIFMLLLYYEGTGYLSSWWQLSYYLFCGFTFCTALALITSACTVFVRDTVNVVGVFIQIFFWVTPIFWDPSIVAGSRFRPLLWAPFNYVIQGYRDSLFNGIYFWDKPTETIVFWTLTLCIALVGLLFFKRTRPHFADVL